MSAGRRVSATPTRTPSGSWQFSVPAVHGSTRRRKYTLATRAHALRWRTIVLETLAAGDPAPDFDPARLVDVAARGSDDFATVAAHYLHEMYVLLKRAEPARHQRQEGMLANHVLPA